MVKKYIKVKSEFLGLKERVKGFVKSEKGEALTYILVIVAGVIIGGLIVYPGARKFAKDIVAKLGTWWTSIEGQIFETSVTP